jgi:hypothetical protein
MNSGSSASSHSGSHTGSAAAMTSSYQTSRPACMGTLDAGALHHDHGLDARALGHGAIGADLHRDVALVAAQGRVLRDQQLAARVVDAVAQRVGAERAEHHGVHRADAGAGEAGDRGLRDHLQVDRDAVALADPERLERVGELVHRGVELAVRQLGVLARDRCPPR